jgi:hypothetical protein
MNSNSGPLTEEAMALSPLIDAALPASGDNTDLIIRLSDLMDKVEKLELSLKKSPWKRCIDCLPPRDMGVLICLGNIMVTAGYYFLDEKGFRDLNCPKEPLLVGVTHWCEMPRAAENYVS